MLELAVAEAYRPRVPKSAPKSTPLKSSSFATNPSARASAFSIRSRLTSSLSSSSSAYSHPRSFKSIISRRKRPDSVLSSTTEVPEVCTSVEPPPISASWPQLPPIAPLPPQEELEEFDLALQAAIDHLQTSSSSSAHDQALTALSHLAYIADIVSCVATTWPEFWTVLVHAAKLLCSAKVDMSVGVKSSLVGALEQVARRWNEEQERGGGDRSTAERACIAGETFDEILQQKKGVIERLSGVLRTWLEYYREGVRRVDSCAPAESAISHAPESGWSGVKQESVLRILTPTFSSAMFTILSHTLSALPNFSIAISVLSDRDITPPLELSSSPSTPRFQITIFPALAVGTTSQNTDILLLHAEAIDPQGNIQSTTGALGAAACAKILSPDARVVVLASVNSIIPDFGKGGKAGEAQNVLGVESGDRGVDAGTESLEWVPAQFLDAYLMDMGVLGLAEVKKLAAEAGERDRYIFGE